MPACDPDGGGFAIDYERCVVNTGQSRARMGLGRWRPVGVGLARLILLANLWDVGGVHALQVTDDRGVAVTFDQPPQRIVSLLPSLTETVC